MTFKQQQKYFIRKPILSSVHWHVTLHAIYDTNTALDPIYSERGVQRVKCNTKIHSRGNVQGMQ
jgi:hypothetical protein